MYRDVVLRNCRPADAFADRHAFLACFFFEGGSMNRRCCCLYLSFSIRAFPSFLHAGLISLDKK